LARQIAASGINIVLFARREDGGKGEGEKEGDYGGRHRVSCLFSRDDSSVNSPSSTDDLDIGPLSSPMPAKERKREGEEKGEEATFAAHTMAIWNITHHFCSKLASLGGSA